MAAYFKCNADYEYEDVSVEKIDDHRNDDDDQEEAKESASCSSCIKCAHKMILEYM